MSKESFGDYIRKSFETKDILLKQVMYHNDINTTALSKLERSERPALTYYSKAISDILEIDLKAIQTRFIADRIKKDFCNMEHLADGLKKSRNI